ncbi:ATP synthase subunit b [Gloeocapsa sp. PCC 7428]|uniref:F0F1 ATP synthase subunit B n=1 Tax=Gloeocapsa sp. PCC 7428 TaxID=1173026 RepID=UPI0002A5F2D3|nr:F0F1 ATP synthase subunit B [Gloeocapsa sp. PCC 7428]AFZ29637.1 ATP synthase subunit b [Gloeocapsa sp. PCC 7428]
METFLLLMAEASAVNAELAEGNHGFGLNFDILETNLINLAIIIGVLFFFGRKVVGKTLSDRRERIETAIVSAQKRANDAKVALEEQQQKLAQAQAEAEKIRNNAQENAKVAREKILATAVTDIERMKETASQDLNAERDRAIAQLRQRVVSMALEKVESQLQTGVDNETQQKLIDRSIALLGGRS